ncbi:MAG: hypothetical protein PVF65_12480 [Sphingomonadales bacterium]|jgi:hypothetical protein
MASTWRHTFVLVDSNKLKTTLNFKSEQSGVDIDAEFSDANTADDLLAVALAAVTDANIYSRSLTYVKGGSPALPADADITDVAIVLAYLTGTGVLPKYATLRIPAPVAGIFGADGVSIDKTDTDLIAYVAELAADFVVSDGEPIVTDIDDGIAGGSWTSVKKTRKAVQSAQA